MNRAMNFAVCASIGALILTSTAHAADLPMTKAEPVEYVKVCSEFGDGFYYIPGSDTCLSINGYVRADTWWFEPTSRASDGLRFNGRGRVNFDARTATEWGTLRSFVSLQYNHTSGTNNSVNADKAFIQFGGWTAGYATSFYNYYDAVAGNTLYGTYFSSSKTTHLLAYTATFGSGLAATISLEDNYYRREGILSPYDAAVATINPNVRPAPYPYAMYGGQRAPDVVASLRWTQEWGSAQIMAAAHQNRDDVSSSAGTEGLATNGVPNDSEWGYAVGAGVLFNMPAGFFFALEGNYAKGAASYAGLGDGQGNDVIDAAIDGSSPVFQVNTGDLSLSRTWSVTADLGYHFTPSLVGHIVGSYARYDAPSPAFSVGGNSGPAEHLPGLHDFDTWAATANLTYTIVKGLTIAGEVSYEERDYHYLTTIDIDGEATTTTLPDYDSLKGGIRLKRTF